MIRNEVKEKIQLAMESIMISKKSLEEIKDFERDILKHTFFRNIEKNLTNLLSKLYDLKEEEVKQEEKVCIYKQIETLYDIFNCLEINCFQNKEDFEKELNCFYISLEEMQKSII